MDRALTTNSPGTRDAGPIPTVTTAVEFRVLHRSSSGQPAGGWAVFRHTGSMTQRTSLHTILEGVAGEMLARFKSSSNVQHRGAKGSLREEPVRFLADYAPKSVTVAGNGQFLASTGETSRECDVMILDASTPPLWAADSYRIAPIECCYATIEVKSKLDTKELQKSWEAAKLLKSLPRRAYLQDPMPTTYIRTAYGLPVETMPPQVHVFAYDSISLETLCEELAALGESEEDLALCIDSVCVLNEGFISWLDLDTAKLGMRLPGSVPASYAASPGNVLMFLVQLLNKHFAVATHNPKFDISAYALEAIGTLSPAGIAAVFRHRFQGMSPDDVRGAMRLLGLPDEVVKDVIKRLGPAQSAG